eukprot:TRINITY_DN13099_c0_g1_i1.p1 TRINITY_DN13099_c0_g1~~TRINITY_DN13099_c0_g1_i1.p1  ORF type:complete len:167 (-),score=47.28 TRINITY_DN13099_c0_g1_i1:200-700(-)
MCIRDRFGRIPTTRPRTECTIKLGVVGIVAVSLPVQLGAAPQIADFYSSTFGFNTELSAGRVSVTGGPVAGSQQIVFDESAEVREYTGDHFCIYIGDFEAVFERCRERELLYVNPRFTWLDDSRTLEQARHWQAFRVMDVRDEVGELLFTEEHEIRSGLHKFLSLP